MANQFKAINAHTASMWKEWKKLTVDAIDSQRRSECTSHLDAADDGEHRRMKYWNWQVDIIKWRQMKLCRASAVWFDSVNTIKWNTIYEYFSVRQRHHFLEFSIFGMIVFHFWFRNILLCCVAGGDYAFGFARWLFVVGNVNNVGFAYFDGWLVCLHLALVSMRRIFAGDADTWSVSYAHCVCVCSSLLVIRIASSHNSVDLLTMSHLESDEESACLLIVLDLATLTVRY